MEDLLAYDDRYFVPRHVFIKSWIIQPVVARALNGGKLRVIVSGSAIRL
jgi:hypothetical protein